MDGKLKVHASCGFYVGEEKWQRGTDWYKEPDECMWEGFVEVDRGEWEEECVSIICPYCKAELHQSCDHFDKV